MHNILLTSNLTSDSGGVFGVLDWKVRVLVEVDELVMVCRLKEEEPVAGAGAAWLLNDDFLDPNIRDDVDIFPPNLKPLPKPLRTRLFPSPFALLSPEAAGFRGLSSDLYQRQDPVSESCKKQGVSTKYY